MNSWSKQAYLAPDLPDPICQGSMVHGVSTPAVLGVGQPLFFVNPHNEHNRVNVTLSMSATGGQRWSQLLPVATSNGHIHCSGYSGLVQFQSGQIGVAFDDGGPVHGSGDACEGSNGTFVLIELQPGNPTRVATTAAKVDDDICVSCVIPFS